MKSRISAKRKSTSTVKLRKNGKHKVDAASTIAVPVSSVRRIVKNTAAYRWMSTSIAAFTPNYIEMILRGALAGDHVQQWQLFDLMLETWPTLSTCQQELLYGVTRRDFVFDPYAEEDEKATDSAIEREKLVTEAIEHMKPDITQNENGIDGTIEDIMDAWFRGISVLEILWQNVDTDQGLIVGPKSTVFAHPSNYGFNEDGILGLVVPQIDPAYAATNSRRPTLMRFPDNKFLIAIHKAKAGSPLGGAMLRSLAWWWCASNFSADWLLNLAQIFGLPLRWANYAASTPDETVAIVCNMLQNMGSAGWAAFEEGTQLELKEATQAHSGHTPQGDLLDRADGYARAMILGQTMTGQTIASGRGGQAFGTVEAQLKQDRLDAACWFVADVINQQLIPAILMRNYGETSEAPSMRFLKESEGTYQDAQRDQILTTLGLPIPMTHLQQKYNVPEPTGGEETTHPPPKPAPAATAGPAGTRPIGQTPNGAASPRQVQAKLEEISKIQDDQVFAVALRRFAAELVTAKETEHE